MNPGKKYYFASDFHLGIPDHEKSLDRERKIIRWLEMARKDAEAIYLVGDIFDFWFEYKYVVPKGYVRLLGKLGELRDEGIRITAFKGNHDMWMFGYFEKELSIPVISDELILEENGKRILVHHGDGLGPGDRSYKLLKKIFRNPICQWLFSVLPPRLGFGLANHFSSKSRLANQAHDEVFKEEEEWLLQYTRDRQTKEHFDYYIFGHRHLPLDLKVDEKSRYINLGEWIHHSTYAVFDGQELRLEKFENDSHQSA